MPKIYIDTNIFIDIYQAMNDPVSVLDDLGTKAAHLITTEQTIAEFRRNRSRVLAKLVKQFEDSVRVTPYCTSLIRHLPEFKSVDDANTKLKAASKTVATQLRKMQANLESDAVANKVLALLQDPKVTSLRTGDRVIEQAQRRKLLGNPPTTDDKFSIGDEVIWETLLGHRKDLIIVSRYRTYLDNQSLLIDEYKRLTNHTLSLITDKISEALVRLGETPSEQLRAEEERMSKQPACPKCGSRPSSTWTVATGDGGTSGFICSACGNCWTQDWGR